jgi:hypothetical protein
MAALIHRKIAYAGGYKKYQWWQKASNVRCRTGAESEVGSRRRGENEVAIVTSTLRLPFIRHLSKPLT